jgi:hypothetical protein
MGCQLVGFFQVADGIFLLSSHGTKLSCSLTFSDEGTGPIHQGSILLTSSLPKSLLPNVQH